MTSLVNTIIEKVMAGAKAWQGGKSSVGNFGTMLDDENYEYGTIAKVVLFGTDVSSTGLDAISILSKSARLGPIGSIVSLIALEARSKVILDDMAENGGKISSANYINLVGDVIGIASAPLILAAGSGIVLPLLAVALGVAILGNSFDEKDQTIDDALNSIGKLLVENPLFGNLLDFPADLLVDGFLIDNPTLETVAIKESNNKIYASWDGTFNDNKILTDHGKQFTTLQEAIDFLKNFNVDRFDIDATESYNHNINTYHGNDAVRFGSGDDTIDTSAGHDQVFAGEGRDTIHGGEGSDLLKGEGGDDKLFGDNGDDIIDGGLGNDQIDGGDGDDTIDGGTDDDVINGGNDNDIISGGLGQDDIDGGDGDDEIDGGDGNDIIHGGNNDDTILGEQGQDEIDGGDGDDSIDGGIDSDTLSGGNDDDSIEGGAGNDLIHGGNDEDTIYGQDGNDRIYGDDGNDILDGGLDDDIIYGGIGKDELTGGSGSDQLFGGDGVDTYIFQAGDGHDVIHTYDGIDKVKINSEIGEIYRGVGEHEFDLIISYGTPGNYNSTVTIENFYLGDGMSMIDELISTNGNFSKEALIAKGLDKELFASGTMEGLNGYKNEFKGYAGVQKVIGGNLDDDINLSGGNEGDVVFAGSGDDTIRLGGGDDNVNGGDGDDKYYLSGGHDIILDAEISGTLNYDSIHINKAISVSMIKAQKSGLDMIITYGQNDSVVIKNWYSSTGYKIENLSYGAGTASITWKQLEEMAKVAEEATPDYKANNMFDELFKDDFFKGIQDLTNKDDFKVRFVWTDPLVLDLDGDGVKTVGTNMNVHFDHDGDGYKEQTGWLSGSDGFVVLDRNNNGKIDGGSELFGTNTNLSSGEAARDGYDALNDYDLNHDGKIDSNDAVYNQLKIWTDSNYNGISETDELHSLSELGIKSISTKGLVDGKLDAANNIVVKTSTFEYQNGQTGTSNSLEFNTNKISVGTDGRIIIDERLLGINEIDAMGYARSLKESATINKTLGDLLISFRDSSSRVEKIELIDNIIVQWSKTSEFKDLFERIDAFPYPQSSPKPADVMYDKDGVSSRFDYLAIAEIFSGKTLWQVNNTNVYVSALESPAMRNFYDELKRYVYSSLIDGTQFKSYKLAMIGSDGLPNLTALKNSFESDLLEKGIEAFEKIYDFTFLYKSTLSEIGLDRDDYLIEKLSQIEWPPESSASLKAMGINLINGTGSVNTDIQLINRFLIDEETSKINEFVLGGNNNDSISISGSGATIYARDGDDTIVSGSGSQEIHGGSGNDVIDSGYGSDVIFGDDGDDVIGNSQQDRNGEIPGYSPPIGTTFYGNNVTGGKGNDVIYGTTFGDIYNYQAGDGNDVVHEANFKSSSNLYTDKLVFGNLITSNNTILIAAGLDLIIKFKDSSGSITFKNHFSGQYSQIDQILFSDGTVWAADEIADRAFQINGTDANDIIYGNDSSSYSDVIYGGSGDDIIYGYRGADKLYGESGNDTLKGGSDNDYLDGGEGNDIIDGGYGSDILIGGDGNDTIGNGTEDVTGISPIPPGSTFLGNIITGGRGDDTIYGSNFGDIFNFNIGDGKDIIYEQSRTNDSELYTDKIIFGDQVNTSNIILNSSGSDVVITFQGSSDSITLKNQLSGGTAQIDRFVFKDGTIWNQSEINNRALTKTGTEASDTLTGNNATTYGDIIYGGAGNDIISGLGGADRLYGEAGNDNIKGGNENDYLDGGEGDDTLDGGNGSDVLIGGSGNDILGNSSEDKNPTGTPPAGTTFFGNNYTGGTGDDTIYGSWYGDIYNFNIGDGKDTIIETALDASVVEKYADRIVLGQDVLLSNLSIEYVSNALVIHVGSQGDQIKINAWNNATSRVERIELFDGTILDQTQITNLPTYGAAAQMNQSLDGLVQAMSSFGVDNTTESSGMTYVEHQQVLLAAPQ